MIDSGSTIEPKLAGGAELRGSTQDVIGLAGGIGVADSASVSDGVSVSDASGAEDTPAENARLEIPLPGVLGLKSKADENTRDRRKANGRRELATEKSLRVSVSVLAAGAAIALLYYGSVFLITIVIASIIAFLLEPAVVFFMKLRMPRGLASFVVCSIALAILYLAGLGIYLQLQEISDDLPAYGSRVSEVVGSMTARLEKLGDAASRSLLPTRSGPPQNFEAESPANRGKKKKPESPPASAVQEVHVQTEPVPLIRYLYDYVKQFYSGLLMASFVPFLVYFLLSWRDHLRSRYLMMFESKNRPAAAEAWGGVGDMVRAYVVGNFLLGLVLSIASALLFAAVKLPYWLMVAPLSGFMSLVPYIGLPLAMVPPVVAALPATREPAVYLFLTVSVAILHLLALNLLYPKFVGARVHLNPIIATVALMFWGVLWGAFGLLLAIPLTAGVKALCDHVESLRPFGRFLGD